MRKFDVMIFNVGEKPFMKEIEDDSNILNEIVGGYLEMVRVPSKADLIIICNEEGKLKNLPQNLDLGYDIICGNFLVARDNHDGDLTSLTEDDKEFLQSNWGFSL